MLRLFPALGLILLSIGGCISPSTPGINAPATVLGGATTSGGTGTAGATAGSGAGTTTQGQLQITPLFFGAAYNFGQARIAWSLDGNRLAWVDNNQDLWTATVVAGAQPTRLLSSTGVPLVGTSPGVAALPFSFQIVDPRSVPALNGTSRQTPPVLPAGATAAVSPNGLFVAYVTSAGTLETQPVGGGTVTTIGSGHSPSWSADGRLLGFVVQSDYVLLDTSTGASEVFPLPANAGYPVLAPNGRAIAFPVADQTGSGISIGVFTTTTTGPTGGGAGTGTGL